MSPEEQDTSDERKGLLWEEAEDEFATDDPVLQPSSSSRRRRCCAGALIALILAAVVIPALYFGLRAPRPVADFDSQKLRSNGTHQFKKTALIVSIDGLRYVCSTHGAKEALLRPMTVQITWTED